MVIITDVLSNIRKPFRSELPSRKEYRCMNCGKVLTGTLSGPYAKRFCCKECRDEYVAGSGL